MKKQAGRKPKKDKAVLVKMTDAERRELKKRAYPLPLGRYLREKGLAS